MTFEKNHSIFKKNFDIQMKLELLKIDILKKGMSQKLYNSVEIMCAKFQTYFPNSFHLQDISFTNFKTWFPEKHV